MAPKQTLADWCLSATPEQLQRGDWRIVCAGLRTAKERFADAGLGNQSWLDCYIQIAESRGKEPEAATALATQPQAPQGAAIPRFGNFKMATFETDCVINGQIVEAGTVVYFGAAPTETPEVQK